MSSNNHKVHDIWDTLAAWLFWLSLLMAIILAVSIIGWQAYTWIRTGTWPELYLTKVFVYFGIPLNIVYFPTDWHGLAKIARWILELPLSFTAPCMIVLVARIIKMGINQD